MKDGLDLSNRRKLRIPYEAIMETALPGDILFFISDSGRSKNPSWVYQEYRKWLGFSRLDTSEWHTTVYVCPKKESKGAGFRPHIIHAVPKGTFETYVPPEYFTNKQQEGAIRCGRTEIIQCSSIEFSDRTRIVEFCYQQLGKPFDDDERWYRNIVTVALGLKSLPRNPAKVSCHGLAYDAYGLIGMSFPHQLENAPNLVGRMIGHPLGHPPDNVDLRSNYLRDHYLYRDNRFSDVIALYCVGQVDSGVVIERNPTKYSWNRALQIAYGLSGFLYATDTSF